MPTYDYLCPNHGEFEESHSISTVLTHCPKCKEEGKDTEIKRLISFATPGKMELVGQELVDKVKEETKQLKKDISKDANKYANLLGDSRYNQIQTQLDRRKKR